ncbi:MAG: hypothetical protein FWE32_05885 [Oscillospiraceae bacterium]|nr:hypothetical protein [Oscillospiraceae bacterium]
MTEIVLNTSTLPEPLTRLIATEKVRVKELNGVVQLFPVKENVDCTVELRGMFAGDPEMTMDRFLERTRVDKGLDL